MTVEQQVDALATAVDGVKASVATKKATLDASVADAQAQTALAQTSKTATLSARDQASAFKDAAYTAAQSAASAVAYQDLTALALSKAVTAVDVFIYDTSKDSDGGAWRHRCAGTSWFNETLNTATRGARREFPAVAVLVLEKGKLTIYDGDDPDLPMWMVINGYSIGVYLFLDGYGCEATSIAARNGALVATGKPNADPSEGDNFGGALIFNFVSDTTQKIGTDGYNSNFGIENGVRVVNFGPLGTFQRSPVVRLPNGWINDVAMTVLPDAQENPSTGLPELTLAFATKGGVAVLRQDGSVISSSETLEAGDVVFTPENELISGYYAAHLRIYGPVDQLSSPTFAQKGIVAGVVGGTINVPFYMSSFTDGRAFGGTGSRAGLTKLMLNSASIGSLCAAAIASSYTTGWMPGAVKGVFLADTDTSSLVGAIVEDSQFTGTGVTDGWTIQATATNNNGVDQLNVTTGASSNVAAEKTITGLTAGAWYKVQMARISTGKNSAVFAGTSGSAYGTIGVAELTFKATATTQPLQIRAGGAAENITIDSIKVERADADRSVSGNGLVVKGTITRAPVAAGAELVGYSGFASANYLEQLFTSAMDFGAGDFCAMGWVELNSTGYGGIFHLSGEKTSTANPGFCLYYFPTGVGFKVGAQNAQSAVRPSGKTHICGVRSGTTLLLYVNGSLVGTYPNATNSATPSSGASLLVGGYYQTGVPIVASSNDKFALLRISATAPTADQIRRIYEDEKALFQENAACTLYGASDAVTALAHDPDTGLLHVGTSAGRSVFKGLRRVANTTTPVATAIAACGDLVVEQ